MVSCLNAALLDDGVPKRTGLLDREVVIGTLPTFVGAGHEPHPASLALGQGAR